MDDRGKQSRAQPDERRSVCDEVFPVTHKSGHKHGMAEFTTSLEITPSARAARGGEGGEWC